MRKVLSSGIITNSNRYYNKIPEISNNVVKLLYIAVHTEFSQWNQRGFLISFIWTKMVKPWNAKPWMSPKEHVIKPLTFYKKKDIQFLPKKPSAQKLHTLKTGWSFCCSVMEIFKIIVTSCLSQAKGKMLTQLICLLI